MWQCETASKFGVIVDSGRLLIAAAEPNTPEDDLTIETATGDGDFPLWVGVDERK